MSLLRFAADSACTRRLPGTGRIVGTVGTVLTLLIVLTWGFSGCAEQGRTQKLSAFEIDTCAWLIEDLCHGLTRSPRELVTDTSSIGQLQIASWLARGDLGAHPGADLSATQSPFPLYIQKRRDAWPLLRQGLRAGILSSSDGYLIFSTENTALDPVQTDVYSTAIANENQSRLNVNQLALQHAGLEARSQRAQDFLNALIKSRLDLDQNL